MRTIEAKSGRPVISPKNAIDVSKLIDDVIKDVSSQEDDTNAPKNQDD